MLSALAATAQRRRKQEPEEHVTHHQKRNQGKVKTFIFPFQRGVSRRKANRLRIAADRVGLDLERHVAPEVPAQADEYVLVGQESATHSPAPQIGSASVFGNPTKRGACDLTRSTRRRLDSRSGSPPGTSGVLILDAPNS
jgi:hypothetical protein